LHFTGLNQVQHSTDRSISHYV